MEFLGGDEIGNVAPFSFKDFAFSEICVRFKADAKVFSRVPPGRHQVPLSPLGVLYQSPVAGGVVVGCTTFFKTSSSYK